ncbi:MAG: SDR family oxidoreductase [Gammaproteobacteria bacterium]|nr:SDR family oxidoreductase [Gammaproteobacteria bacterium]
MPDELPTTPSFRLDGRRAVVTGAGRGIGRAAAAALAQAGAEVTLVARTAYDLHEVAEELRASGATVATECLDVTDVVAVQQFFARQSAFHILVNNAGTNRPLSMLDVTEDDYDAVLDLNLKAMFFVAQAAARRMIEEEIAGSMIHMGSQMGHVGGVRRSLYCASKWGLEGMNKAFALDLAPHRIRSNTIAPTFIETPMTRPFLADSSFMASVMSKIKLGRLGQVEDLMGAIVFLAGDASSLMTGASLVIDGGWTAD